VLNAGDLGSLHALCIQLRSASPTLMSGTVVELSTN
jgi:hypothetical protein